MSFTTVNSLQGMFSKKPRQTAGGGGGGPPPTDNLYIYYTFDVADVSGATLYNRATLTYDTILTGTDMTVGYTTTKKIGTGSFYKLSSGSGSTSCVKYTTTKTLTSTSPLTMCYWFQSLVTTPTYAPTFQWQITAGRYQDGMFRLNHLNSSFFIQFGTGGQTNATLPSGITNINDGGWYHLIVELTGTTCNYFINNTAAGSFSYGTSLTAGTYKVGLIGVDWNNIDNNGSAKFIMDDFRLYSRVLTSTEKTNIYNYR